MIRNMEDINSIDDELFSDIKDAGSNEEKISIIISKHGISFYRFEGD